MVPAKPRQAQARLAALVLALLARLGLEPRVDVPGAVSRCRIASGGCDGSSRSSVSSSGGGVLGLRVTSRVAGMAVVLVLVLGVRRRLRAAPNTVSRGEVCQLHHTP